MQSADGNRDADVADVTVPSQQALSWGGEPPRGGSPDSMLAGGLQGLEHSGLEAVAGNILGSNLQRRSVDASNILGSSHLGQRGAGGNLLGSTMVDTLTSGKGGTLGDTCNDTCTTLPSEAGQLSTYHVASSPTLRPPAGTPASRLLADRPRLGWMTSSAATDPKRSSFSAARPPRPSTSSSTILDDMEALLMARRGG